MSEYWNRSGEVDVEFDVEKFTAKLYIDGKFVLSCPIWNKLTPKEVGEESVGSGGDKRDLREKDKVGTPYNTEKESYQERF